MPNNYSSGDILDKLLERVDFFGRISVLKDIGIIDKKVFNQIMTIKDVRNGFAHLWGEQEVKYKSKILKQNFEEFRNEAEAIWKILEDIYIKEQDQIDIDKILIDIEDLNNG